MISFPPFRLDPIEQRLWRGDTLVAVRRKPLAILRHLATNPYRLVTHDELIEHVWAGTVVSESAVRSHLHELRQVLGDGVIETVVGRGYRFAAPLAEDGHAVVFGPDRMLGDERVVVGRDVELEALRGALERASTGHRQLCFITGEPGIGKTTLIDRFLADIADRADVIAVRGQCIEQHGTPEAYLAVIDMITQLRKTPIGERALALLVKHAPTFVAQIPHLVPDDQLDDVNRRARGGTDARLVRELSEMLEALSTTRTIVIVLEDLQWSDLATIDLLNQLGQRRDRARLMLVGTSRHAEAHTVSHPLNRVMRGLVARSSASQVALHRIALADIRRFVELRFPDHAFPDELIAVIDRITGGTPLFVVHILDDLVARGMVEQRGGRWQLAVRLDDVAAHRPDSVKQMIDIQLDRLGPDEQRLLEAAATIGLEFSTALLAAALELPLERVDELCDGLARRALFLRRDGTEEWPDGAVHARYRVTHGLVGEVCTARSAASRRQRWHRLVAAQLEAVYADRVGEVATVLATHYHQGQQPSRAVTYYVLAAERAVRRFAVADAMTLYARALDVLGRVAPSRERDATELQLRSAMVTGMIRIPGWSAPDTIASLERMIALATASGDKARLAEATLNLSALHTVTGSYRAGMAVLARYDALVRDWTPPPIGTNAFWQGDLATARRYYDVLLDPAGPGAEGITVGLLGPTDRHAISYSYLSMIVWLSGDADEAVRVLERGIDLAHKAGDPFQQAVALCYLGRLRFLRGDPPAQVQAVADRVLGNPGAQAWHAHASLLGDWARSTAAPLTADEVEELEAAFRERLAHYPMGQTAIGLPVIDALRRSGQRDEALALVAELVAFAHETNEQMFLPELIRLRGQLLEPDDREAAAEAYRAAVDLASQLGAVALARRARADLDRLAPRRTERHA
jgi:DNA-binding winged helix-turn-helix (wHTH) protein/tetratricopeptide (TPR) repeat protein